MALTQVPIELSSTPGIVDNSNATAITIDSSENVGIGTSSPASLLDVSSTGEVISTIRSTSTSGARGAKLRLNVASTGGDDPAGTIEFTYGTGYTVAGSIAMSHTNPAMKFLTGTTERMRIDSSGNVMINATALASGLGGVAPQMVLKQGATNSSGIMVETSANDSLIRMYHNGSAGILSSSYGSTGAYHPLVLETGGSERMRIDSSGNVIVGGTVAQQAGSVTLEGDGDIRGVLSSGAGGDTVISAISGVSNGYQISVTTGNAQTYKWHNGDTQSMTLDSSGNLLVGKTAVDFSVDGVALQPSGVVGITRDEGVPLILNRKTSDGDIVIFQKSGVPVGSIGTEGSDLTIGTGDTGLQFRDASDAIRPFNISTNAARDASIDLGRSSERFRDLYLSGGVVFGTTGGSVTSKTLDDYEEGTWTPTITNSTGSYTTQVGRYTKIGNLVYVNCNVKTAFTNTGTTPQSITGLPFTSENVSSLFSVGTVFPVQGFNQGNSDIAAQHSVNSTSVALYTVSPATGINYTTIVSNTFGTTVEFEFSLCYRTT